MYRVRVQLAAFAPATAVISPIRCTQKSPRKCQACMGPTSTGPARNTLFPKTRKLHPATHTAQSSQSPLPPPNSPRQDWVFCVPDCVCGGSPTIQQNKRPGHINTAAPGLQLSPCPLPIPKHLIHSPSSPIPHRPSIIHHSRLDLPGRAGHTLPITQRQTSGQHHHTAGPGTHHITSLPHRDYPASHCHPRAARCSSERPPPSDHTWSATSRPNPRLKQLIQTLY